jgi:hypothetical protein
MTHILSARDSICLTAAAFIFTLTGCTLTDTHPQDNTAKTGIPEIAECVPVTAPTPVPIEQPPVVNDPTRIGATPVCPIAEPQKCPVCAAVIVANKPVLGEYELVTVNPPGFAYLARIDTGATSTSLHADQIIRFERDGQKWVRFNITDPDTDKIATIESELERRVRIKQADDVLDRRLVVMMTLRLGNIERQIEVSLTDRANMEFPLLIGRNFLLDTAVVDVSLRRIVN